MAKRAKPKAAKTNARKPARRAPARGMSARRASGRGTAARRTPARDPLLSPIPGADRREIGSVQLDIVRTGSARVKREIYPPGFRWSEDMKPVTGTGLCMHAHVGFLASGEIHIEYADGCVVEYKAPAVVAIEPGHDGWVVGREPAVLIEFDFERDTVERLGMPAAHRH